MTRSDAVLPAAQVRSFVDDGCVRVPQAVPRDLALRCRDLLWRQVTDETGAVPDDPVTWTRPVHRIECRTDGPFRRAATSRRLHAALDQVVGVGRWRPRTGLGTFPVRFPHPDDPGDAGWHVEAGHPGPLGEPRLDVHSTGRALLLLFLFSDVGEADAPTRVRIGSHRAAARLLAQHGAKGAEFFAFAREVVPATDHLPVATATGAAGDVWLVHPFLVHGAQRHRGTRPRFLAQPPLEPTGPLRLAGPDPTPVEEPVRAALASA